MLLTRLLQLALLGGLAVCAVAIARYELARRRPVLDRTDPRCRVHGVRRCQVCSPTASWSR